MHNMIQKLNNLVLRVDNSVNAQRLMVCGTAGLMITAGGACGYQCRKDRAIDDRDVLLNNIDDVLTRNIKDCNGDEACIQTERNKASNLR